MASAICTTSYSYSSSSSPSAVRKPTRQTLSASVSTDYKTPYFRFSPCIFRLGPCPFSPWNGLRHLDISIRHHCVKFERKRKGKGKGAHASLFGVGAPEALVIGVVALLVFGPKGLAEVARNLGKTLRAFQPTIRELQDVSREFKSTLEREIGLDDLKNPSQSTSSSITPNTTSSDSSNASPSRSQLEVDPDGARTPTGAFPSEEYLKTTEEQLKSIAAQEQKQTTSVEKSQIVSQTQSQDGVPETAATPPSPKPESET